MMQSREKEVLQRLADLEARCEALETLALPAVPPPTLRARVLNRLPFEPEAITRAMLYRGLRVPAAQLDVVLAELAAEKLVGGALHKSATGRPVQLIWREVPL